MEMLLVFATIILVCYIIGAIVGGVLGIIFATLKSNFKKNIKYLVCMIIGFIVLSNTAIIEACHTWIQEIPILRYIALASVPLMMLLIVHSFLSFLQGYAERD